MFTMALYIRNIASSACARAGTSLCEAKFRIGSRSGKMNGVLYFSCRDSFSRLHLILSRRNKQALQSESRGKPTTISQDFITSFSDNLKLSLDQQLAFSLGLVQSPTTTVAQVIGHM